jgi:secreted trypsin-like serine protease
MRNLLLSAFICIPMVISCKKDEPKKENKVCQNLPESFKKSNSDQYITNGCDELSGNIPGEKSTVYVWLGIGGCTGTVISEHFVLTAAHCLYSQDYGYQIPSKMKIVIGNNAFNLLDIKTTKVKKYFINPLYLDTRNYALLLYEKYSIYSSLGDIAIVQTEGNLIKDYGLVASKMTHSNVFTQEEILSIGYGLTGKHDKNTAGLKRWSVSGVGNFIKHPEYDLKFKPFFLNYNPSIINNLYAPNPEDSLLMTDRKSKFHGQVCNGDSGGPQFVKRNTETVIISVTHGFNASLQGKETIPIFKNKEDICNKINTSLSTRVAPYFDWINNQMKPYGEKFESIDLNSLF